MELKTQRELVEIRIPCFLRDRSPANMRVSYPAWLRSGPKIKKHLSLIQDKKTPEGKWTPRI